MLIETALATGVGCGVLGYMLGRVMRLQDMSYIRNESAESERRVISQWLTASADEIIARGVMLGDKTDRSVAGNVRWDSAAEAIEIAASMIREGEHVD